MYECKVVSRQQTAVSVLRKPSLEIIGVKIIGVRVNLNSYFLSDSVHYYFKLNITY